jgi:hypothetical protein
LLVIFASTALAQAATTPRLNASQWATCEDNNPWVKSGWCEQHAAWNKWRCTCPGENFGGGGSDPVMASKPEDDHCGRDEKFVFKKPSFTTFKPSFSGRFSKPK